jgi:hypothetical protein
MTPQAIVEACKVIAIARLDEYASKGSAKAQEAKARVEATDIRYTNTAKAFVKGYGATPDEPNAQVSAEEAKRLAEEVFGYHSKIGHYVNVNGLLLKDNVRAIAMTALHELAHAARGVPDCMGDSWGVHCVEFAITQGHDTTWEHYAQAFGIAPMAAGDVRKVSAQDTAWEPELLKTVETWNLDGGNNA